ncbi:neurotactin-like, partial [Anthonomus grandis grandis]|uniref:neurotactin-like n=1 Tax=Anthonomus grandis grandis TaxID=2921223 RepID=UPI002165ACB8
MSQTDPSQKSPPPNITEDKKSIQEEEREKILNIENEQKTMASSVIETSDEKKPKEIKEGMEVKPKKIPIGGIQMPGFFTRSKSKEQCKEDDQIEGTELIEQDKSEKKEDNSALATKIKLPNPFKKTKPSDPEEGDKAVEPKDKIKLLDTIRMPLVSVFQRMKRNSESQNLTTNSQAGLASLETLDEKSANEKDDMKNVNLNEKKDDEKHAEQEDVNWMEKLKGYKIAI